MNCEGLSINFLGDSITFGFGALPARSYVSCLKRELHLKEARNYGVSGSRIARQNSPLDLGFPFVDRYKGMDEQADVVVVFGGTNDYGHGDAPIGSFEDRTECTFYGALHLLMEGLMVKYPLATIVFMTPLHRLDDHKPSKGNNLPLSAYADIIKEVAEAYAIPVLDLYRTSGMQPNVPTNRKQYMPDGLHPNSKGHALLASRLKGFLESL
ncbi:MAG: SGNH/GDSL hydrolase family protein [Eubacteriales bacterium]